MKNEFWARRFRQRMEQPLNTKLYLDNIAKAGLSLNIPQSGFARKVLKRIQAALKQENFSRKGAKAQRKPFRNAAALCAFAPLRESSSVSILFVQSCLKANFLWHLSLIIN